VKRRAFITLVGGAAAVLPLAAWAQQRPAAAQRVGFLSDESPSLGQASFEVIAKELGEVGYVQGRNIGFETRYADGNDGLLPGLAAELVRIGVDVIVAVGTPATRAAKGATGAIPIVFTRIADPLALGLVTNLARPGANLTGVSVVTRDLAAKRLDLLVEMIPGIKQIGALWDATFPSAIIELNEIEHAAPLLRINLRPLGVRRAEELEPAMRAMADQGTQALTVIPGLLFTEQQKRVAEIAIRNRLPTMLSRREHVEAGGLMSYGTNYSDMYRRAAAYVDKVLKGTKPGDLPVEQPTRFELVINLKTAKALDLDVPWFLQQRADEVIE
jgi:putative tryptophan/tyrosine transport system substrate-binding protein